MDLMPFVPKSGSFQYPHLTQHIAPTIHPFPEARDLGALLENLLSLTVNVQAITRSCQCCYLHISRICHLLHLHPDPLNPTQHTLQPGLLPDGSPAPTHCLWSNFHSAATITLSKCKSDCGLDIVHVLRNFSYRSVFLPLRALHSVCGYILISRMILPTLLNCSQRDCWLLYYFNRGARQVNKGSLICIWHLEMAFL